MATAWEIVLFVLVVVGLATWYYTSVYRPACNANKTQVHAETEAEAKVNEPMATSSSMPSPLDDPSIFSTVPRRVIPNEHRTLSLGDSKPAERDRPEDGAHLRSLPTDVDEETGAPVVPAGPAGGMSVAVISNDIFSTFEEAPAGVTAAMWPTSADENEAEPASMGMLPGGADNARAVESAIVTANKTRVQEDIDGHMSMKYGAKALARQIGAQGGATGTLFAEYFKRDNDFKPKLDIERCRGVTLLHMPEYHPCFAILQDALEKERKDAKYVSGVASMAYREFLQPTY